MAKAYSQFKVNELKDILRERGLSLNGTKSELIARLEEDDASKASAEPAAENTETPAPQETTEAAEPEAAAKFDAEPTAADTVNSTKAAAPENTAGAPQASAAESTTAESGNSAEVSGAEHTVSEQLSDEELMRKVKEDIEKQIARAKRFGGDPTPLEQRLNRINKFGIGAIRDAAVKAVQPVEKKRFRKPKNLKRGPKPGTA